MSNSFLQPILTKIVENFIPVGQKKILIEDDDGKMYECMLGGHQRRECYLAVG